MRKLFTVGMVGLAFVIEAASSRADEAKVELDKLPKPVVDAVKKKFPQAELNSASSEKEDGKLVYEVNIKDGKATIEVTVTPEGKIVSIEKEITVKDLGDRQEVNYPVGQASRLSGQARRLSHRVCLNLPLALPKAVAETLETKYPRATIKKVEEITKEDKVTAYEVLLVTAEKKTLEVSFNPEGKVVSVEKKDKEEKN